MDPTGRAKTKRTSSHSRLTRTVLYSKRGVSRKLSHLFGNVMQTSPACFDRHRAQIVVRHMHVLRLPKLMPWIAQQRPSHRGEPGNAHNGFARSQSGAALEFSALKGFSLVCSPLEHTMCPTTHDHTFVPVSIDGGVVIYPKAVVN